MTKSEYSDAAREKISRHTKKHIHEYNMPQDMAVAAAMAEARRDGLKVPSEKRRRPAAKQAARSTKGRTRKAAAKKRSR